MECKLCAELKKENDELKRKFGNMVVYNCDLCESIINNPAQSVLFCDDCYGPAMEEREWQARYEE